MMPATAAAQPANPVRVALYSRVSTDLQATKDEGSLDTQEARLRAALASRAGDYDVRHVFREEGESGKSLDRPALQQLLARVRRRDVDLVMVTRIDRLSRSLLDFYEVHRLFEDHGVQFVSLNETFDTSSAVGRAMLKLVLVFAELEREQTAERTRAAMKARASRGLWNGGHPPLGYDSAGNGHLVVNDAEAALVRLIFDKYIELRSSVTLTKWLNEQGHRQKAYVSRRKGPQGGRPFTKGGIQGMLKNRLYLGEIRHKGQVFEGQHDAIVDRDVFERVAAVMKGNRRVHGPPTNAKYEYLLTGVVRCSCGSALTTSAANGRGGRYHYYRCVGIQKRPGHECPVRQVRAERTDDLVLDVVRETARDPALLAEAVEEANRMAREQVDPLRRRVEQLRAELAEAEESATRTFQQILSAGISASGMAKKLLGEAEERQGQLQAALAQAEGELDTRKGEHLDLEVMVDAIRGFDLAFEHLELAEKREFIQLMCRQVVVHKDRVEIELYEGRSATRWLTKNPKVQAAAKAEDVPGGGGGVPGGVPGAGNAGGQNDGTPGGGPGFASLSEWLPGGDRRQNLGDEVHRATEPTEPTEPAGRRGHGRSFAERVDSIGVPLEFDPVEAVTDWRSRDGEDVTAAPAIG